MDPVTAVTVVGIAVAALLGVFAGACQLLRSDIRDLHAEARGDLQEFRTENRGNLQEFGTENRAGHRGTNARIDRLEGKLDMLILALAQAGILVDPQPPGPQD